MLTVVITSIEFCLVPETKKEAIVVVVPRRSSLFLFGILLPEQVDQVEVSASNTMTFLGDTIK
jgi:hypothetical protein